jgi:acyl-CoA synthetase (AMP-forming)/AMP-acid ligase II/acyl carrier protein
MTNLADIIVRQKDVTKKGIIFFDNENEYDFIAYSDLYKTCLNMLAALQKLGLRKNDKLIIQCDNNKDLVITFWSCILGGIIPAPLAAASNSEQISKLLNVYEITEHPKIIFNQRNKEALLKATCSKVYESKLTKLMSQAITVENIITKPDEFGKISTPAEDDIAFIQFSSGSTGEAKGVVLTHKNLMTNIKDIVFSSKVTENSYSLSWLPITHDMGMIGFHLTPLLLGVNQILMSPFLFISKPWLWMEACNKFRITYTASPNFGYKHFLSKMTNEDKGWDLSCVKLIFNGGESIDADIIGQFLKSLERYRLNQNVMYTVYGMAEASLGVAFPEPGSALHYLNINRNKLEIGKRVEIADPSDRNTVKCVDNGRPLRSLSLRIVDDSGKILQENYVGNIEIKGGNVTKGYYNDQKSTNKIINKDGWLSTGDIGFVYDGGLYVTGRKKDLIILNGVNYYAHDIERVCEEADNGEKDKYVAVSVFDRYSNCESLAIFVRFTGNVSEFSQISAKVRQNVLNSLGIEVRYVLPVSTIYKTASGKIERYKYVKEFSDGCFDDVIAELKSYVSQKNENGTLIDVCNNPLAKKLLQIAKEELQIDKLNYSDNLTELGLDSIKLVQITARINEVIPDAVSISDFYTYPTVGKLLDYIEHKQIVADNPHNKDIMKDNRIEGEFCLESKLSQNSLERLEHAKKQYNIKRREILTALFIYLIQNTDNKEKVTLQIIKSADSVSKISVDVSSVGGKQELYQLVSQKLNEEEQTGIPLKNYTSKGDSRFIYKITDMTDLDDEIKNSDYNILLQIDLTRGREKVCFYVKNCHSRETAMQFVHKYCALSEQI